MVPSDQSITALLQQAIGDAKGLSVLVVGVTEPLYGVVSTAVHKNGGTCVRLSSELTGQEVEQAIAHQQPHIVICLPQVFGWVSKLAFLGGVWLSIL